MRDIVFETLRDEILSGKLPPASALSTLSLSERLGVSRTPIREALNRLSSIGLVENVPYRGCFVRKLSVDQVIEVYCVRAALAGVCARLATRRITDKQKKKLIALCEKMERERPGVDIKAMLRENFEFHNIIFKAAHAPSIEALAVQYYHQSEQFRTEDMALAVDQLRGTLSLRASLIEERIALRFRQQDAIGHDLDVVVGAGLVGETDLKSDCLAERRTQFRGDPRRN
jgi:DNA-binding GntR family transcriptional regulator